MFKWLHHLFNPHCEHCAQERREQKEELKYCRSCESLARENDRLVRENERLLSLLLEKPQEPNEQVKDVRDLKPINTSRVPFMPSAVRRQILEQESRHNAKLAKEAPKPDINKDQELKELEAELDNVRKERESQAVNQ